MKQMVVVLISLFILSCTSISFAKDKFSVAIGGDVGSVFSGTAEAIEDYEDTEWDGGSTYGGHIYCRFPEGFTLGLRVSRFTMELSEDDVELGEIEVTPILAVIGYQGMPEEESGFAGHFFVGLGMIQSDFETGGFFDELAGRGINTEIDVDDAIAGELRGGIDYFFNKNISLNLDANLFLANADATKTTSAFWFTAEQTDTYFLSNFQVLAGINFWF